MLIEGPFESDYSLAIVNRRLALALIQSGEPVVCHQRDNTTDYPVSSSFLSQFPLLAGRFVETPADLGARIHSRYIYPPYTDRMTGQVRTFHCYGWEESGFPQPYVEDFNRNLNLVTVMSRYVRDVLVGNGVKVPVEVAGLGVDHVLDSPAEPYPVFEPGLFHFLHISSCFPRKGADVLVEAFCRSFTRTDGVRLLIKTFRNPHNEIEQIIEQAFARHPSHPPIHVIFDSLRQGQLRYLMEKSNCLVAPSRGEGFGLPAAEAMLLGTPVAATVHGGHADLCSPEWCWPIEFHLEQARTHLTEGESLWAEPHADSLAAQMRAVYSCSASELLRRTEQARNHIASQFTWERTAQRHLDACNRQGGVSTRLSFPRGAAQAAVADKLHIGFVTTWNARCGIAEYTRYLVRNLPQDTQASVFANHIAETVRPDESFVQRSWIATWEDRPETEVDELADRIAAAGCHAVSVQFNFAFFSANSLRRLVSMLGERGIAVVTTMHATASERLSGIAQALIAGDGVVVHRTEDRNRLMELGLQQVELLRQGIPSGENLQRACPPGANPAIFTISCFGFLLPPKGIYELITAFAAASQVNGALRLKLLNSLYDIPESHSYADACLRYIHAKGISERVTLCTDFLDDSTVLEELSLSDLVVLPYLYSTESSSAAVRLPLASLTPVLCSDLPLFDEFARIVHRYPASDSAALANRLIELSSDVDRLRLFEAQQREYVDLLSWKNIAVDFRNAMGAALDKRSRLEASCESNA